MLARVEEVEPVVEVHGRFADEVVAREVADALNRWFAWILDGSTGPIPPFFESLGVDAADFAWSLDEDVDWEVGPHARVLADEVRIAVETRDTYLRLAGLLRRLGALATHVERA